MNRKYYFLLVAIPLMYLPVMGAGASADRIVVDQNGHGDFKTITEAIESLDSVSRNLRTIFIRNGIYNEKLFITKNSIILEGESRSGTVVTQSVSRDIWRCNHASDWGTATLNISADDVYLINLTVQNIYGSNQNKSRTIACPADSLHKERIITPNGHQMALRTFGTTRLAAYNVHFKSFGGDTVSPWNVDNGMFYFKDCIMEGGVDLYCPRGWAYAENCTLIARSGTAIIWHDGSAVKDAKTVLKNCSFEGFEGFNLGRFHRDAQFYLIGCRFSGNMADRDIFLVPANSQIKWGRRVYYYNCQREGGNFTWFADNIQTSEEAPLPEDINAKWVFKGKWNPAASGVIPGERQHFN